MGQAVAHLNRYRINCQGVVHLVEFEAGSQQLVFCDHEPDFREHWERKVAFALLEGSSEAFGGLVTAEDGCQRVACWAAGGPGNHVNRDPEERRLVAALRGARIGARQRLRKGGGK